MKFPKNKWLKNANNIKKKLKKVQEIHDIHNTCIRKGSGNGKIQY